MTYTVFNLGENGIGGMMPMPPGVPDEVSAYWLALFTVADCDASVAKAEELGGGVTVPASDIPEVGRFAILTDPHRTMFGVIALAQPEE
jgi:predicted enzyme related to lactoylglutathione lyase